MIQQTLKHVATIMTNTYVPLIYLNRVLFDGSGEIQRMVFEKKTN